MLLLPIGTEAMCALPNNEEIGTSESEPRTTCPARTGTWRAGGRGPT